MKTGERTRIRLLDSDMAEHSETVHPPHQRTDAERESLLVRRLLARDESAWREFVLQYRALLISRIYAAAAELNCGVPSADSVEEICADVFTMLVSREMESLHQFSGRSRLSTWLSVIVRRTALRALTQARQRPSQPDTGELDLIAQSDGSSAASLGFTQARIQKGMQKLSPDDRNLLEMFYEKQRSYEQIASAFHLSVNAVGPKLDRARKRLQKFLESEPDL
jgi:RNA polymerase sigma-70 factor, ECF subfamily